MAHVVFESHAPPKDNGCDSPRYRWLQSGLSGCPQRTPTGEHSFWEGSSGTAQVLVKAEVDNYLGNKHCMPRGTTDAVLLQVIRECLNASSTRRSSGSRALPGKGWRGRVGVECPLPQAGR